MESISQRDLRNDGSRVMRMVEQGNAFTVTRHGVPVAQLVPLPSPAASSPPDSRNSMRKKGYRHPMRQAVEPTAKVLDELRQERS